MNHYDNGQTVLNDWTAVIVTVGKGWVYGMTEREGNSMRTQCFFQNMTATL